MGNMQRLNISWLINFIQDDQSVLLKFYKSMVGHYYNSHLCYRVSLILLLSQMGFFFIKLKCLLFEKTIGSDKSKEMVIILYMYR